MILTKKMKCTYCDAGNESFHGYHYIESGAAQRCENYVEPRSYTQEQVDVLVADLERQRDTAHAAAIQAAANLEINPPCYCGGFQVHDHSCPSYDLHAYRKKQILALTPANAQRCYDLRIAEAVKDEAKWWVTRRIRTVVHDDLDCACAEHGRLASASAEIDRLRESE